MGNITTPLAARPTIYKGIEMRSRLEARWAAAFDAELEEERLGGLPGCEWEYEPFCFAGAGGQYLPDFRVRGCMGGVRYYDVKGKISDPLPFMERMEIILESEPDAELHLIEGPPWGWDGDYTMAMASDGCHHYWTRVEGFDGCRWLVWVDHEGDFGFYDDPKRGALATAVRARRLP